MEDIDPSLSRRPAIGRAGRLGRGVGVTKELSQRLGGSWGGCTWASLDGTSLFAGKAIRPIAEALLAVDAGFVTGVGIWDAFKALKAQKFEGRALRRSTEQ